MRFLLALLTLSVLLPAEAFAQNYQARSRWECREPIKVAGDAFHLIRAATQSAVKRWQEIVINQYGERFINFDNARGPRDRDPVVHCDPARVGGGNTLLDLKRCVVIARPCRQVAY